MTGFGEAEFRLPTIAGRVTCRSVNHKNLDTRVYLPIDLFSLEADVASRIKSIANRGRVEVRIEFDRDSASDSQESLFEETAARLNGLARSHGVQPPTFRDVLTEASTGSRDQTVNLDDLSAVVDAVDAALKAWDVARVTEGEKLHPELDGLLSTIEHELENVEERQRVVPDELHKKLDARLRDVCEKFGVAQIDETRLAQEVVIYVDRYDIAEELQRAASHVEELRNKLRAEDDSPKGKRVDFYLQELFRECNTMGSKTSDLSITNSVIEMKSAVEKLREQAANIE